MVKLNLHMVSFLVISSSILIRIREDLKCVQAILFLAFHNSNKVRVTDIFRDISSTSV